MAGHAVGYGGNVWAFLQWILGFRRLGFDVYYVEEHQARDLVDEDLKPAPFSKSANAQAFRRLIDRFELGDRAALLEAGTSAHVGLSREDIDKIAPDVDLFLNQFGAYTAVLGRVRRSVYLDLVSWPYPDLASAVRRRHAPAGTRPLSHGRPEFGGAGLPISDLRSSLGKNPVPDRAIRMGDR